MLAPMVVSIVEDWTKPRWYNDVRNAAAICIGESGRLSSTTMAFWKKKRTMVVVSTINELIMWVDTMRIENWELVAKCYGRVDGTFAFDFDCGGGLLPFAAIWLARNTCFELKPQGIFGYFWRLPNLCAACRW